MNKTDKTLIWKGLTFCLGEAGYKQISKVCHMVMTIIKQDMSRNILFYIKKLMKASIIR